MKYEILLATRDGHNNCGAQLGKLGRVDEAKPFVEELLQIKPDFQRRPHEYLRRLFVTDEHVDMIWDGLVKTGIQD